MESPFLTPWISGPMMNAICWTLIHSLWIGLLVAVLAGGIITGTRKASSWLRYQLLCCLLLLFVGLTGFIFYRQVTTYQPTQTRSSTPLPVIPGLSNVSVHGGSVIKSAAGKAIVNQLTTFVNQQTGWLFALWLVFFAFKSLKLISGLYYVHRIRYHKVYSPGDEWKNKVLAFGRTLGIQQSITLVQSELVKVPVTVGILKPVILLPMGLLFQLPPEQIETILWHELAHIWRRDYLVNLLQSLVETVFFFNPALLWLSSLIREERETCCDDIVLAHTARKSNYLEALLAFQSYSDQPAAYAMALGFGSRQLMNRLKRIVNQENKRLSVVEKIVLLLGLVLLSAATFIPQKNTTPKKRPVTLPPIVIAPATNKLTTEPIRERDGTKPVTVALQHTDYRVDAPAVASAITTAQRDTARIFTSILFAHSNQDMANRDMMVSDDKGNRYRLKIVNNELLILEVNGVVIPDQGREHYNELLPQIDRALAEKRQLKLEAITEAKAKSDKAYQQVVDQLKAGQLAKASHRQQEINKSVAGSLEKKWPAGVTKNKPILAETYQPEKLLDTKKRNDFQRDADGTRPVLGKKRLPPLPSISNDQERVRGVIAALVQEKIVADPTGVDWFGLSNDELIVNGQKQPAELQQKLKEQFGIQPSFGLYFGPVKMSGTGVFLEKSDL